MNVGKAKFIPPSPLLAPKNDIKKLLSIEVIQATQNQNARSNQSCSGKLMESLFLILFKPLPVEKKEFCKTERSRE